MRGLYRGLEALLWRNGIWNSCYFGVAATIRHYQPPASSLSKVIFCKSVAIDVRVSCVI
jgi:hypothetical protein